MRQMLQWRSSARAALEESDEASRRAKLQEIVENSDLASSRFMPFIQASLRAMNAPEQMEAVELDSVQ